MLSLLASIGAWLTCGYAMAQSAPLTTGQPIQSAVRSAGAYTASNGSKSTWQITGAHALIWNGAPYLPVGGTFTPHSFATDADTAWQADTAALSTLKAHNIQDLIIWPDISLIEIPAARLQRLIDYLDSNGFHYGLSFGTGLTVPMSGFVVRPAVYRFEDSSQITALWQVSDTDAAAYFMVDANRNSEMIRSGMATVRDGVATAPLEVPASVSRPVALLLPRKAIVATSENALPDLYGQFDSYRDKVLAYLSHVKLGVGFRFFLDPLARHLGLTEEAMYMVPESDAFRLEWESFLTRRYSGVDEIRDKWRLNDDFKSVQELARLIPLWSRDRGFPYLFDPTTGKTYRTDLSDNLHSTWWDDFAAFRANSFNFYLNAMAEVLKQRIADVPVVYTFEPGNAEFVDPDPAGGLDGLAISTRPQEPYRLARVTGPAYSQAEQAGRTLWLITSQITGNAPAAASADGPKVAALDQPAPGAEAATGYASAQSLASDLAEMNRIGLKGFFVDGFQTGQGENTSRANWLSTPESLDWLHAYASDLTVDPSVARLQPQVLYYPEASPGPAHAGTVTGTSGVYWLPSRLPGRVIDWWPSFSGYSIQNNDNSVSTVLLSLLGPRKVKLTVPNPTRVTAVTPEGIPAPLKPISKNAVEVTFGREPLIFNVAGQDLVPQQAAQDTVEQLAYLVTLAKDMKTQSADYARIQLDEVAQLFGAKNYIAAYAGARQQLDVLTAEVQPYSWIEGETSLIRNFTEYAPNPEASAGGYLRLSTPNPPPKLSYAARYTFNALADGEYEIWLAGTPPGPDTSPITWYVDQQPEQDPANPKPQGPLYLRDHFGWYLLGKLRLERGEHNLTIKVTGRAPATHLFSFSIDAVMIAPRTRPFIPNGTIRPIPIDPSVAEAALKAMQKSKPKKGSNALNPFPE